MSDDPANDSIVAVVLAEFAALRTEISNRSSAQQTLMNLNFTAIGGIGGLVLAQKVNSLLLLLLPLLSPTLGMLWVDHAINITHIGDYIGKKLRKTLKTATGAENLLGYEEVVDRYERHRLLRFLPFGIPLFLVFAGVPIGSLGVTFRVVFANGGWPVGAWVAGLLLTVSYLIFWTILMRQPFEK